MFMLVVFGLADVKFMLHSLLVSGCSRLVPRFLPSTKIWYVFGVLSKKRKPCCIRSFKLYYWFLLINNLLMAIMPIIIKDMEQSQSLLCLSLEEGRVRKHKAFFLLGFDYDKMEKN
jgi:hypothetical protein